MDERIVCIALQDGEVGVTLGANYRYFTTLTDLEVVGVCASPSADDAGLTVDINVGGTGVINGVDAATKVTPGTWKSTHLGGANAPVHIASGSVVSLDANNAAADTRIYVQIFALTGKH